MKKVIKILTNLFKRHQVVETITLSTGVVCVHTLDTWNDIITIKAYKNEK